MFVGLRCNSIDYFSYEDIYNQINNFGEITLSGFKTTNPGKIEPGFALLVLINKYLNFNFVIFIFLFSLFSLTLKFFVFHKCSSFLIGSLLIYVSDNLMYKDMSQIRSALASGIILLAFYYFSSKKTIKSLLTIIFACSIHFFSFIAFLFFFTKYLNLRALWIVFIVSILISLSGGGSNFLFALIEFFNLDQLFNKVYIYKNTVYNSQTSFFSGTNLLQISLALLVLYKYKLLNNLNQYNKFLTSAYILFSSLFLTLIDFEILWGRVRDMFLAPIGAVILTSFLVLYKNEVKKAAVTFSFIIYSAIWFYLMIPHRNSYQSIFNLALK
jgi:hypothetical protein